MLAEFLAGSSQAVMRGVPPDGRGYWQARFWDRDAAESHPVLADSFLRQQATTASYRRRVRHIIASPRRLKRELAWAPRISFDQGVREFAMAALRRTSTVAAG